MAFNTTNGALPQGLGSGTDASSAMEQCEQEEIAKAIALSLETDQSDGASRVETSDPFCTTRLQLVASTRLISSESLS